MPADEPRYFRHYDGDERVWRIYDTAVEDDLPAPLSVRQNAWAVHADADAEVITDFLNVRAGVLIESRAPGQPQADWNDRNSLIRWIRWNDRNADVSDEDAELQGLPPLTLEDCRTIIRDTFLGPGCLNDASLAGRVDEYLARVLS